MPPKSIVRSMRSGLRQQVTKKCNTIEVNLNALSSEDLNEHLNGLLNLKEKLDDVNKKVLEEVWDNLTSDDDCDKAISDEMDTFVKYDDSLTKVISLIKSKLTSGSSSSPEGIRTKISQLKLPELPLPTFSNKEGDDINKFFREFESTVSQYTLSTHVKFTLLTRQLNGDPAKLVNSLECSKRSYEDAKELLQKAFADTLSQQYAIIKQLSKLQLSYQSDPYEYISNMRIIIDQFSALSIDKNLILQYFIWYGLNDCFKNQLINITGSNKPSLQQIESNIFVALERYKEVSKKFHERKEKQSSNKEKGSTNLAAVVSKSKDLSFKECSLCLSDGVRDVDHPIFKCSIYLSPKSKADKLQLLGSCLNCANSSHRTSDCRFKFNRRCKFCGKWHFSYLCRSNCPKPEENSLCDKNSNAGGSKDTKPKVSKSTAESSLVWADSGVLQISCNPVTALPSFTLNESGDRAIKDSGSQITFVAEDWAKMNKFKVIDGNYPLVLNGINSSKPLVTKVYEVKFADKYFSAVAMPEINIKLNLPGISEIAKIFRNKGYELADKTLHLCKDKIENIKLLVGNDNAHVIPQTDVVFGGNSQVLPSVYLDTTFGVMLTGDLLRYKENLNLLSNRSRENNFSTNDESELNDHVDMNIAVLTDNGQVIQSELERATEEILSSDSRKYINYDSTMYNESFMEENENIIKFVLDKTTRDCEGRLVMPLLWNGKISHLLGKNQKLSKAVLRSNFKKYSKQNDVLLTIDKAFKEQEQMGIIERVDNLEQFLEENPQYSFLPHMPVIKMDRETTKCRNVFLSNLCEPDPSKPMTVSHNQAITAGPCLNKKISTSILQLRFDEKVLCFDLKKAFSMIKLTPSDQSKLLFYWYKNVAKQDFSLVTFKNCRLPFGLTCSPALLMLALHIIMNHDVANDCAETRKLKKQIYNLAYMDNLAVSYNDSETLEWAYSNLQSIFSPYQFSLQQFITNDEKLQSHIDRGNEPTPSTANLLGLLWDRKNDTILTRKLVLDQKATTKRSILSSIASNFDVFSFCGPLLNRARLFMHRLQCAKEIGWDEKLQSDQLREWVNICKQLNSVPEVPIKRFIGRRDDPFKLVAYCDASKDIYGVVLYILNLRTKDLSFLLSKNRIVGRQLESKSIPTLELQSVCLGTEVLIDTYKELSGSSCISPINILSMEAFSDSAVTLNWLNSHINRFDKMRKRSIFVMNRLHHIEKLCETFPVTYKFCAGASNPADCTTRSFSYKQLLKTNFFTGPSHICKVDFEGDFTVTIPNPLSNSFLVSESIGDVVSAHPVKVEEPFRSLNPNLSLTTRVSVCKAVLTFINNLKLKLKQRDSHRYEHFSTFSTDEISAKAYNLVILSDQHQQFSEVFEYFKCKNPRVKDMPLLVSQLNLFVDDAGFIRVKSKFSKWKDKIKEFPILLAKGSELTEGIIMEYHRKLAHSGIYTTLSEIRKRFWIPSHFSTIKKVLKTCIHCRRFNGRTIRINQSPYRDFRISPPTVPYRYVFIDYFGPYWIKWEGKKTKAWVLCITCLWSRAVNLKLCLDMTVETFLRALQLHCFEFGVPELCLSDQGSQLIAGGKIIEDFLNDRDTLAYFSANNIKPLSFQHYYKGHNELGSLVEICVKMTKRLIDGSIRNMILSYLSFEFLIQNVIHIVNKRPIALKEYLRNNDANEDVPSPITPEILLKGHELNSLNIIPQLHPLPVSDPNWTPNACPIYHAQDSYKKLRKARESLIEIYNNEFLTQLMAQSTDKKSRYRPVDHKPLKVGDIVLIKEPLLKPTNFPMGIVKNVQVNSLGEVTGATILKGKTREVTKRHVSSLIPLLCDKEYDASIPKVAKTQSLPNTKVTRPKRQAAEDSQLKTAQLIANDLV